MRGLNLVKCREYDFEFNFDVLGLLWVNIL